MFEDNNKNLRTKSSPSFFSNLCLNCAMLAQLASIRLSGQDSKTMRAIQDIIIAQLELARTVSRMSPFTAKAAASLIST